MHTGVMDIAEPEARRRVAEAIRSRRGELKLRQEDVTAAGGPSKAVMFQIENGAEKGYSKASIAGLEDVLRWQRGSIQSIADGGDPTPLDQAPDEASDEPTPQVMTAITGGGLRITVSPAPGYDMSDVISNMAAIMEATAKVLDELDGKRDTASGESGQ